jgi:hypothetical protein
LEKYLKRQEQIKEERMKLRIEYGSLFDEISAILFKIDPMGINYHNNSDEYESETGTILPRLHTCESVNDIIQVIREELIRWFHPAQIIMSEENYRIMSEMIWEAWQRFQIQQNK